MLKKRVESVDMFIIRNPDPSESKVPDIHAIMGVIKNKKLDNGIQPFDEETSGSALNGKPVGSFIIQKFVSSTPDPEDPTTHVLSMVIPEWYCINLERKEVLANSTEKRRDRLSSAPANRRTLPYRLSSRTIPSGIRTSKNSPTVNSAWKVRKWSTTIWPTLLPTTRCEIKKKKYPYLLWEQQLQRSIAYSSMKNSDSVYKVKVKIKHSTL